MPLRTFVTFKDIAQFEILDNLKILHDAVTWRLNNAKGRNDIPNSLKVLGAEALLELEKRLKDDPTFIQKLGTSFSMALTDLINDPYINIHDLCLKYNASFPTLSKRIRKCLNISNLQQLRLQKTKQELIEFFKMKYECLIREE